MQIFYPDGNCFNIKWNEFIVYYTKKFKNVFFCHCIIIQSSVLCGWVRGEIKFAEEEGFGLLRLGIRRAVKIVATLASPKIKIPEKAWTWTWLQKSQKKPQGCWKKRPITLKLSYYLSSGASFRYFWEKL